MESTSAVPPAAPLVWSLVSLISWSTSSVSFQGSQQLDFKQNVLSLVELCALSFAFCMFVFPLLLCWHVKLSDPYYRFDILVRCFSYCCPTLVVRWTVLLPKALNRWTGLYYQRWVSVLSIKWGALVVYHFIISSWMIEVKTSTVFNIWKFRSWFLWQRLRIPKWPHQ